jgi:UrcA family protein
LFAPTLSSFQSIQTISATAQIEAVEQLLHLLKEIEMNNTKTRAIRAITISAAIVLGFSAAAASAGTSDGLFVSDGINKYTVRFPDLDLSKVDGAVTLYGRLRRAAAMVCSPLSGRGLALNPQYRACVDQAIAGAVQSVASPMLSQYHESRTKGDKAGMTQLAKAN